MARQQPGLTLRQLKAKVYGLAAVSTTKQLKAMSPQLAQLDFRRKSSWTEALQWLEAASGCFEQWLAQPPEEYRALFAEINEAVGDLQAGIRRGFELSGELLQSAESLEREAAEVLEESQELRRQAELHREQRARGRLN